MSRPGGISEQTHVGSGQVGMTGNGEVVLYCLRAVRAVCRVVEATDSSCVARVGRKNGIGYEGDKPQQNTRDTPEREGRFSFASQDCGHPYGSALNDET